MAGQTPAVFDGHSDLLKRVIRERDDGRTHVIDDDFLPHMRRSNVRYRVAGVKVDNRYMPEQALRRALGMVEALLEEVETSDHLSLATAADDLEEPDRLREDDRHALVLGLEGAQPLMGDLDLLPVFHRLGMRLLTICHSRRNEAGDGCFYFPTRAGTPGGLTDFGVDLLERLPDLGVVLDVSHLNVTGFWDVVDVVDGPFIASHSNCRALHDHPRNLHDDQIHAVADAGGVVGVLPVADFLDDDDPDCHTLERLLDHVDHIVELAGVDHAGFGFDFFDYQAEYHPEWATDDDPVGDHWNGHLEGLRGDRDVHRLGPALAERGYDDHEVENITHGNFRRVFRKVMP